MSRHLAVDRLFSIFHRGLLSLIPVFEDASLAWREPDAYDEWDMVAATLYQSIIGSAVRFAKFDSDISELVPYDKRITSYSWNSFMAECGTKGLSAFICFTTDVDPLDSCLFASLDRNGNLASTYTKRFRDVKMAFVPRGSDGISKPEKTSLFIP